MMCRLLGGHIWNLTAPLTGGNPDSHYIRFHCKRCRTLSSWVRVQNNTGEHTLENADEEDFDDDPGDHCGMLSDGTCQLAGIEWCDWECPYNQTD